MNNFNKLAARKELGAILYRLNEQGLDPAIRRRIISRHLLNLFDTLPESFHAQLVQCSSFIDSTDGLCAAVSDILTDIPLTYGSIPAGSLFYWLEYTYTKRKNGREFDGFVYSHLAPDAIVTLLSEV